MNYRWFDMLEQLAVHAYMHANLRKKNWNEKVCDGDKWAKIEMIAHLTKRWGEFVHRTCWEIICLPEHHFCFTLWRCFSLTNCLYTFAMECGWRHDTSCNVHYVCAAIFPISSDKIQNTHAHTHSLARIFCSFFALTCIWKWRTQQWKW